MNGGEFLYPESNTPSCPAGFQFDIFFSFVLSKSFVFPLSVHLHVLLTLLPSYTSICLFSCVIYIAIVYSKIVQFPLHLVVGIFSCQFPLEFRRIFFCCFGMYCSVCFTFCQYLLNIIYFAITFLFFFSSSCIAIFSCFAFFFLSQRVPGIFLCFIIFACLWSFLNSIFSRIPHPGFDFLFLFFKVTPPFSLTNLSPA